MALNSNLISMRNLTDASIAQRYQGHFDQPHFHYPANDAIKLGLEQLLKLPQMATHNQIETAIRFLKAVAGVLILNFFEDGFSARWILKIGISVGKFSGWSPANSLINTFLALPIMSGDTCS